MPFHAESTHQIVDKIILERLHLVDVSIVSV